MEDHTEAFIEISLKYQAKYKNTSWWKFKKKLYYKSMRDSAQDLVTKSIIEKYKLKIMDIIN